MMTPPIRVVMVDDHRIVREGLRAMLDAVPEIAIVGEAEDLSGALDTITKERPDVVLLDVRLQRASGLDACRAIIQEHPDVKVVFLTVYEDEQYVFEALRVGARGYMLKKVSPEDLLHILQAVQAGEVMIDPSLGGKIALRSAAQREGGDWPGAQHGLTPRESEVLVKIVDGLDNKAIGQALYITEDTVKSHVKSILRKLGARDRGQAISITYKEGLIS